MNDENQNIRSNNDSNNTILKAGLLLALALAGVFGYLYFNEKQSLGQTSLQLTEKNTELAKTYSKLDSMSNQLDAKIAEVASLGGQVTELQALKASLENDKKALLSAKTFNAKDYSLKIKNYEAKMVEKDAELAKLREENGVLNTQNQNLNTENTGLKTHVTELRTAKEALTDSVQTYNTKNKELTEKVTLAAALRPVSYLVGAINSRGKERDGESFKARRVDRVKVAFKLAENPLTQKESKTIYMRMISPEGSVISDMATGSGVFTFGGKETVYTAKQNIMYANSGQSVEFIYARGAHYEKGDYKVELYADGFRIGQTNFTIR